MKKYELTEETTNIFGKTLHRIRATRDFSNVHAGDLGGFIEDERNLSHDENAWVSGKALVSGEARVGGDAWVYGNARVCGNALVKGPRDIYWISCIGSRDGTTTFFRNANNGISVSCGCFYGTIDEFAAAVTKTHGDNEHAQAYRHAIEIAKLRIKLEDAES
nr:MAG TPA: Putative transferase, nesg, ydcK, Structural Genomics.38A [Caudoviricetes sp.]